MKNLPHNTNEAEVRDFFLQCGTVDSVRLVYNPIHKHFKGFGYVDFKNKSSVKEALKLDGKVFNGRMIIVDIETSKPKEGFKYRGTDDNRKYFRQ